MGEFFSLRGRAFGRAMGRVACSGGMGALVFAGALGLAGCNNFFAQWMVTPPNGHAAADVLSPSRTSKEMRIAVKSPPAALAYWVRQPPEGTPVKGTVLLLHGFVADHTQLEGPAKALQKAGYRAVLVDLRGHGKSTADHITFGVDDARDLAQLTDELQRQKLCGDTIGVFGTSYGATSALLFAGSDPRVTAVVAVAPFATLREEAPYFGKHVMPVPGLFMSAEDYTAVINRMGRDAGFDPDACDAVAAIRRTRAQVLLIHGTEDLIVSSKSSEEIAAAAPGHCLLELVPGKGHLALVLDWFGALRPQEQDWFDRYLAETPQATAAAK